MSKKKLILFLSLITLFSCSINLDKSLNNAINVAGQQLSLSAKKFIISDSTSRSWENGKYRLIDSRDWTSGFVPGEYWLYYQITGDKKFEKFALHFTSRQKYVPYFTHTHDLGFMVFCSYGKQWEVEKDTVSANAIVQASKSLISRFDEKVGAIRSWDFGEWNYPVIIDNMMNLDMLFWTSEYTKDPIYRDIAIKHADKTLANHFRNDYSTYHVVSYNNDGTVELKGTFQGYSDESSWARGQAWALYGYTMCYDYTKFERYLERAKKVASLIMNHKNKPEDNIPYWDYDAPNIPNEPRDASAAAITASALIKLSTLVDNKDLSNEYLLYAEKILDVLSSDKYLAKIGDNGYFILMHSTGAASLNSEIDVPLNYADYYYLEAIKRYRDYKGLIINQ